MNFKEVKVKKFPKCDMCGNEAHYDAIMKNGQWANMCDEHFKKFGGTGEGFGQKFVLFEKKEVKVNVSERIKVVEVPMTLDYVAEVQCPYCGCGRNVEPDANYTVSCEECQCKYKIESMI